MKKILIYLFIFFLVIDNSNAQDYPTGLPELTKKEYTERYSNVPLSNIRTYLKSGKDQAITYIDNSKNKYFPPIILQDGNTCAHASGIHYIYNYEFCRKYDLDGQDPINISDYLHIAANLNDGADKGGFCEVGWDYLNHNGVPSIKYYKATNYTQWSTGYNSYYSGLDRATLDYKKFDTSLPNEVEKMKQYLIDYGDGSETGGVIQFSAYAHSLLPEKYEGPSTSGYDAIVPYFASAGMHSMTIVGFDDEIFYDYNENGIKDEDELGAFICVNSWGTDWGTEVGCTSNGRFYAPYVTFTKMRQGLGGTGNGGKGCLILTPKKEKKDLVLKIGISHNSRNDISLNYGFSELDQNQPEKIIESQYMKNKGGDWKMRGNTEIQSFNEIELALNLSKYRSTITDINNYKAYLFVVDRAMGNKVGTGELLYAYLMDYSKDPMNPIIIPGEIIEKRLESGEYAYSVFEQRTPELKDNVNSIIKYIAHDKSLYLTLNTKAEQDINVILVDENGEELEQLLTEKLNDGISNFKFDLASITKGTYGLKIISSDTFIYEILNIK